MNPEQEIDNDFLICKEHFTDLYDQELAAQLKFALNQYYHSNASDQSVNTYLKDQGIPQIVLFDILANRFPLVLSAQEIVKQKILEIAADSKNITIVDLGIGRGIQIIKILEDLTSHSEKDITIIGFDIVKEALEFTKNRLEEFAIQKGIKIHFHSILKPIEHISLKEIITLIPLKNDLTFVNASLSLHHMQHIKEREHLFQIIHDLQPDLFSIIEPYANTFTSNRVERMINSYIHFTSLYAYINTLDLSDDEKKGLKTFFYNDFSDTIINNENYRFEKYEPGLNWLQRGIAYGFKSLEFDHSKINIDHIETVKNEDTLSGERFISFRFKNWDVLSVILFTVK